MDTIEEIRARIKKAAEQLKLDPDQLMRNYGVTSALAEMLEKEIQERCPSISRKMTANY